MWPTHFPCAQAQISEWTAIVIVIELNQCRRSDELMMIYLRAEAVYLIDSRDKEACLLYTSKLQTNSLTIHEMEAAYTNQQIGYIVVIQLLFGSYSKLT